MQISRAIDVGYGNTKFTVSDGRSTADIECRMFPSVAPVSNGHTEEFMDQKNSVIITMESGEMFEVGPDAMLGMASNSSRSLDLEFSTKDTYMALVRGAMYYMDVDRIDHLVVGLPVSSMDAMGMALKKRLTGEHRIPNRPGSNSEGPFRTLEVRNVRVVPQPVGGMYDFGVRHGMLKQLEGGNNLLIDPGYFTLDWVVTNGMKMVPVRSGAANNAGMAAILRSIAEKLAARVKRVDGKAVDITEGVLERLDRSLRTGTDFVFNGKPEKLDAFMVGPEAVVRDALNKMRARVGTFADIDRIIIVGGAAHLYKDAVQEMFQGYDVRVSKESVYSNVRGFQLLANSMARAVESEAVPA